MHTHTHPENERNTITALLGPEKKNGPWTQFGDFTNVKTRSRIQPKLHSF